ncbi:MAG: DNA polymerase domain-containing protein, partial [Spirochaeta sp.]
MHTGFLAHAWSYRGQVRLSGRLSDGRSFAAVIDPGAQKTLFPDTTATEEKGWRNWQGNPLTLEEFTGGVVSGMGLADGFLLLRGIRGSICLNGEFVPGQRVDCFFRNPEITAAEYDPALVWAAVDIETDREDRVLAASIVCGGRHMVVFHGDQLDDDRIRCVPSERDLLETFAGLIRIWDPDVITGWNVADFDFSVLAKRFSACGIPFDIGRTGQETARTRVSASGMTRVIVPGRQVVDSLRVVRGSGRRFEDMRLETVAQQLLGTGKSVSLEGEDKLAELERLRSEDPVQFCLYCLRDSRLVLEILAKTGLDSLTAVRAGLTGVSLDMAWTSIPAFERIYALELVGRRVLPPQEAAEGVVFGAPGGTVLDPVAGLFSHVMVFDFRSLYPSIMRTFNIDPLGYEEARRHPETPHITAPNEARFSREPGILPALLDRYFSSREKALASGDEISAYVYKILMNSFYGVLGSSSCIYARRELAGAITGFGKLCLHFARDFFQKAGLTVLYGDTDSVFVYGGGPDGAVDGEAQASELNHQLDAFIGEKYGTASAIKIRFEKAYRWFLLPKLRSQDAENRIRGRAKGYAGLSAEQELEMRGIEAVRSDYTALARRFQTELLELLFAGAGAAELDGYVRRQIADLLAGKLDHEIVYRKVLRRSAQEYTHAATPQVRAARKLGWTSRRGRIAYIMTVDGPEPVSLLQHTPDYRHYIEHQLKPLWMSIAETVDLGDSLVRIMGGPSAQEQHPAAGK